MFRMRLLTIIFALATIASVGLGSCSTIILEPDPSAVDGGKSADIAGGKIDAGVRDSGVAQDGTVDGTGGTVGDGTDAAPR